MSVGKQVATEEPVCTAIKISLHKLFQVYLLDCIDYCHDTDMIQQGQYCYKYCDLLEWYSKETIRIQQCSCNLNNFSHTCS